MNKSVKNTLLVALLFVAGFRCFAGFTFTKFPTTTFCTNTYPTAYITGSFSISESKIKGQQGFRKNQSNKTLIFSINSAAFAFLAGTGTVSATGTDITINSYVISASGITVNLSSGNPNSEFNSINFTGLQIRATGPGTTTISRTGGTFLIDNSTANPSSGISLGDLSAGTPFAISANSTTQGPTTNLFPSTIDNQIIKVAVTVTGNCSSAQTATSFTFNTSGSGAATQNAATNLTTAKLYETDQTNVFANTSLFGSVSSPNGSFVISGSKSFTTSGTYYFWLVYDIGASAIGGNLIDASFTGFTASGTSYTATSGNPSGSRTINSSVYYSISSGLWNDNSRWSLSSGGASCNCVPTSSSAVYIAHSVTLDINSPSLFVVNIQNGGYLTDQTKTLTVTQALTTSGNGYFNAVGKWSLSDITTSGTGLSTSAETFSLAGDLVAGAGTTLQLTGGAGKDLTVNGNVTVNGRLILGASSASASSASGLFVSGTGTISGTGSFYFGINKTVTAGSALTFSVPVTIAAGVTLDNYGTVTIENNLTGLNSTTSKWVNRSGSLLAIGGTSGSLLTTGVLDVSASGNTVSYKGSSSQAIKTPSTSYCNLISANAGLKSYTGSTFSVTGNLTISGSSQFSMATSSSSIYIGGNLTNNSSNALPFAAPNTFFLGTDSILGSGITTFTNLNVSSTSYLRLNPSTGKIIVKSNYTIDGDVDPASSDVTFDGSSFLLGSNVAKFFTLIINSAKSLTISSDETDISGDFIINGSLTPSITVFLFNGFGIYQELSGTGSYTFTEMELDNSNGGIILTLPISLSSSLTLTNGIVETSSTSVLSLLINAVLIGGSSTSYVSGPMSRTGSTDFVFPIGKGGRYARIGVSNMTSSNTFKAEYFNTAYTNTGSIASSPTPSLSRVSKQEHWILDRTVGSAGANVTLFWSDASFSGINSCSNTDLNVARFNGTAWVNASEGSIITGTCSGTFSGSIATSTNVVNFSPFTFGSKSTTTINLLPLKIANFDASCINGNGELSWTLYDIKDVNALILESSKDGATWKPLKRYELNDQASGKIDFNYVDEFISGVIYYRLVSIDIHGLTKVEKQIDLVCKTSTVNSFKVITNPSCNSINIKVNLQTSFEDAYVYVYNEWGVLLCKKELDASKNVSSMTIMDHLTPGLYFITIGNGNNLLPFQKAMVVSCE